MIGTPKQIEWAEKIKAQFYADLDEFERKIEALQPPHIEEWRATIRKLRETKQESAAWWIDNREELSRILETIYKRQAAAQAAKTAKKEAK